MSINKFDVVSLVRLFESLVEYNRGVALDSDDASLRAFFNGRASAYEMCVKWIEEDILHEKKSR